MYKIIVVEDEPTALNHVRMILQKKCPQYEVVGTAENGQEALELIEKNQPDVLISDVKMPILDGIQLVAKVKEKFPEILSIIVSGYSEFEYAKGALQSGVCDYLLKPLAPSDMKNLMDKLELRLNTLYYEKRNEILKALCSGKENSYQDRMCRYFPGGRYYAAIYRKNGLPKRFSRKTGVEIFSMEEEKVYIYGRDEMEALYLFHEELIFQGDFQVYANRIFQREQSAYTYLTAIINEDSFMLHEFPGTVKKLYRKLDESVVIGENQMLTLSCPTKERKFPETREKLEYIEYLIRYKENGKLLNEIENLFYIWKKENNSQLSVEADLKYMLRIICNQKSCEMDFVDIEFMLDDAFYYALSMQELMESILAIVKQCIPELGKESIDNKEQLFHSILSYMNSHIEETITLGSICKEFGVSQTSLSKMFRIYKGNSFSNYLTDIRIEKAKQIMCKDTESYVKDIAERCGYSDQFYFSRIFRSVTGVCPKEYMERMKM